MSDEASTEKVETATPALPPEPEPGHILEKRASLKEANAKLSEALKHLDAFVGVYGADAPETEKARERVIAAQVVANAAAHHKSVALLEHGVATMAHRCESAKSALQAAAAEGDIDAIHEHSLALRMATNAHAEVCQRLEERRAKEQPAPKEGN